MKLQDDENDSIDINLTPLIDVVFLLLIFFMVSTTFSQNSELQIELPEATAETQEKLPDVIEIAIDKKGQYFVEGKELLNTSVDTLKRALQNAAKGGTPPIVISADANTPHQAVVTAMDAARKAGLTHLTFATMQPSQEQ